MSVGADGAAELDGFVVGHLPSGIGELVSDFAYEWEDVAFASRVWEREVEDGHQVDLQMIVLRGDRLTDVEALHLFLADYHEIDPGEWALREFPHPDGPGFLNDAEAFWLAGPGVGVTVRAGADLFGAEKLSLIASTVRPAAG